MTSLSASADHNRTLTGKSDDVGVSSRWDAGSQTQAPLRPCNPGQPCPRVRPRMKRRSVSRGRRYLSSHKECSRAGLPYHFISVNKILLERRHAICLHIALHTTMPRLSKCDINHMTKSKMITLWPLQEKFTAPF